MNKLAYIFRESLVTRILIPTGIILIVFSFFVFKAVDHMKDFAKTEAIVSKTILYQEAYNDTNDNYNEATYEVYVKYNVDGKEYEEELGILSGFKENDKVTIAYNPNDPTEIGTPSTIILPILLLTGGIVALIGGIFSAAKALKKYKALKEQEEGWSSNE